MTTYRKIKDTKDNVYVFELPDDVNANQLEDIILACEERIGKLIAYRVAGDKFRDIKGEVIGHEASRFNHPTFRRLDLGDPEDNVNRLTQEEFGKLMVSVIEKSKEERIGKVRVTEWEGEDVFYDHKGPYLKVVVRCAGEGCRGIIRGTRRLSVDGSGVITRPQAIIPDDPRAQRVRHGSKLWHCPACAVRKVSLSPEEMERKFREEIEPEIVALASQEPPGAVEKINEGVGQGLKEKLLRTLLSASAPSSELSGEYVKGIAYVVALVLSEEEN